MRGRRSTSSVNALLCLVIFVVVQFVQWTKLAGLSVPNLAEMEKYSGFEVPGSVSEGLSLSSVPAVDEKKTLSQEALDEICSVPPGKGVENIWGYQALIKVEPAELSPAKKSDARVLCIVVTDSTRHDTNLRAIVETFAPQCDGFLAASNKSDPELQAVDIFSSLGRNDDEDSSNNTWEKTKLIWKHVHENHRSSYDFFHLSGDMSYVIPGNLRFALSRLQREENELSENKIISAPIYAGIGVIADQMKPKRLHCAAGAGYALNPTTLDRFVEISNSCDDQDTQLPGDQVMALCLTKENIKCQTLREPIVFDPDFKFKREKSGGGILAHNFGAEFQATWGRNKKDIVNVDLLEKHHKFLIKNAMKGIAENSVSFHLVHGLDPMHDIPQTMRRFHSIVNNLCDYRWEAPLGALDAEGNEGYIHDPQYLKENPPSFTYHAKEDPQGVCDLKKIPFLEGPEGRSGFHGLKKIKLMKDFPNPKRIMCIVYTHSNRHNRLRAVAETYAPLCDGFMATSNLTDPSIGAVNILHEGPELCKLCFLNDFNHVMNIEIRFG